MFVPFQSAFLLMAGGLLAIATAVLVKIFQPYELIFKWKLIFEEGGEIFNLWEKPPVDLYIKIYLFNITNTEEFLAGKEKMKVEQVGPYVYKELMTHDDVVFNDNNTVSTRPRHPLVWQEHLSEGRREDDMVMMLNIALLAIAQVAAEKSYFFRLPINILIRQTDSQPIIKMTAREFMFGYQSSITTLGNTLLPEWIYFDKVGLIDRMYDFDTDFETFHTGADDPSISGLYATYRGSPNLPQWKGEHCSNINFASDGTKFKSYIEPNETVLFFRKSMCRPQRLIRTGEETVVSDLSGYKYIFEENALDNGVYEEKNKCFCRKGYCQPRGLIDVTDCYYGFPISLSYPHFMDADPGLLENVTGSTPNKSEHSSFFILQPRSGLPLTISVKLQINMHMRDVRSMAHVERFSDTTFPMLWFEITMMELPEALKNRFNLYLNILPYVDILGFWVGLAGGIICLVFAITRATLKLPQFISVSEKSCSKNKYGKVNLRSGVYNACEMKLMEVNEKSIMREQNKMLGPHDNEVMMCEIDLKSSERNFMLEDEPAMSDCDDGSDSDNNSQRSSTEEYLSDNSGKMEDNLRPATDNQNYNNSAGVNNSRTPNDNSENNPWVMGEASSLLDDIGNDNFESLKITEDEYVENTNKSSSNHRKSIV